MDANESLQPVVENPALGIPPAPRKNRVLFNAKGDWRSGWRLSIYFLLLIAFGAAISLIARQIHKPTGGTPPLSFLMLQEGLSFALAFGVAAIMSLIEKKPLGVYGLPASGFFGRNFWLGMLFGLAEVSLLTGLIGAFGGYSFGTLALAGPAIVKWGLLHLLFFTLVGFFEEFLFRGYVQYTTGDGIGFWPAAVILSVLFGAVHLGNPGEGVVGAASVVMIGLIFCFSLWRSGNLWYAVGLHAAFDWGETFLYSVPNSGLVMEGHLSNSTLHGPRWLTGGTVGPEGSVFCFLTMLLQLVVVAWLFPKKSEPETAVANVAVAVPPAA